MFCKNLKRISSVLIALVLLSVCILPASAVCRPATVRLRDRQIDFSPNARTVADTVYVPLRAFVETMDPDAVIDWNARAMRATISASNLYMEVTEGSTWIYANGHYLYLYGQVYNWDGSLMLPYDILAKVFGVSASWDPESCTLSITGDVKPISWAYYDEYTLYWLSHIVYSEAGCESLDGMIAVGNVVLNRVENAYWSSDIYKVIFDRVGGVQFSPTENGTIYQDPSYEAIIASKMAMEGANVAGDSLFFLNPSISSSRWFDRNCTFYAKIGHHSFYTCDYYADGF